MILAYNAAKLAVYSMHVEWQQHPSLCPWHIMQRVSAKVYSNDY